MWKWKRKQNKHKRNRNPWTPGTSKWKWKAKKTKRKEKLWDLGSAIRDPGPEKWVASGAWNIFSEYFFGSPVSPEYFLSIFFAALFCPSIFWVFVFVQGRVKSIFGRMDSLCFLVLGGCFGRDEKMVGNFAAIFPIPFEMVRVSACPSKLLLGSRALALPRSPEPFFTSPPKAGKPRGSNLIWFVHSSLLHLGGFCSPSRCPMWWWIAAGTEGTSGEEVVDVPCACHARF